MMSRPPFYSLVFPGGPYGPLYSRAWVSFNGGVVLLGPAGISTPPNAYGTSDRGPLTDGSAILPSLISAQLATPATSVSLTAFNGAPDPTQLTLSAFGATNVLLGSSSTRQPGPSAREPSIQ